LSAPSDKVVVEIRRRVPAEYTTALNDAQKALKKADAAETGGLSLAALKEAQVAFDRAALILPEGEARQRSVDCSKRIQQEEDYARLLTETGRLSYEAERITSSDAIAKLEALNKALMPCYQAKAIFKRAEIVAEIKRLEQQVSGCRTDMENAEKARREFDSRVARARTQIREAEKYQNLSVALPHWEEAMESFRTLNYLYPKRVDEFNLDMKKAQENHDKAYLFANFGIIPAKPEDRLYDIQTRKKETVGIMPASSPVPTGKDKEPVRLLEP
jgi:chromosome segregation ATPase